MNRELVPNIDPGNLAVPVEDDGLDLSVYLNVLRRRYLYLVIPAVVVFAAVCVVTFFVLSPVYEATAKILVQSQLIPTKLAASTVTASASERVKLIEQRLTTRDNLLEIARKFNLYPDQRNRASPSQIVDWIRDATQLKQMDESLADSPRGGAALGFTLSFDYYDPVIASRVANELVSSILQQNIETREARAGETSKFFKEQVSKLEGKLGAMEVRIAEFKKANEAALPETLNDRRQRLAQLQKQIADIDQRLSLGTDPQTVLEAREQTKGLSSRLKATKQRLDNTREQRKGLIGLFNKGYVTKTRMLDVDNQIAGLQADIDILSGQLKVAQNKLALVGGDPKLLPKQRAEFARQAATLKESILKTPDVEATLSALNRDYQNLQAEYNSAKSKTTVAATGQQMEQDRQAERFEVIEQASVPDEPIKPDRSRILLAGFFGSIAAGVGMVILMEMLDKSIRSSMDLERALRIRPLITIPYLVTAAERTQKRRRMIRWLFSAACVVALALFLVHKFYLPLDVLWVRLLERQGIV
jgi:succinoglycan biosynthesis transport protein ExoP